MGLSRQQILKRIRTRRVIYSKAGDFVVPFHWQSSSFRPGRMVSPISKEHATMLAAASGRDLAPHGISVSSLTPDMGLGGHFLMLIPRGKGEYFLQLDPNDPRKPVSPPPYVDLSPRLKAPEVSEERPGEMIPEDFYL